jgi:RNA-directed DNA polymerase
LLRQGYTDVVDADLSKYFDTIPHDELMQSLPSSGYSNGFAVGTLASLACRIVDPDMLRLIKQWLRAPVETTDGDGRKIMEGGKTSRQGVPQGGVISPLIANLYMNRFLKYWRQTGKGEAWQAYVINYADDFVILSRGHAAEALAWTDRTMTRMGLTLNRTKTRLCEARTDRFDFLGYSFGLHRIRQDGRRYIGASRPAVSLLTLLANDRRIGGPPEAPFALTRLPKTKSAHRSSGHTRRLDTPLVHAGFDPRKLIADLVEIAQS